MFEEGSKLLTIGRCAFYWCEHLAKINLPKGLKNIEDQAFFCCENLKSVRFPSTLEKIGLRCFVCSGLEELITPTSLKEIGAETFK